LTRKIEWVPDFLSVPESVRPTAPIPRNTDTAFTGRRTGLRFKKYDNEEESSMESYTRNFRSAALTASVLFLLFSTGVMALLLALRPIILFLR
jgi:hypothetical protein